METNANFADHAASLSAGLAASVMMVVVCFALALALSDRPLSDRPLGGDTAADPISVSETAGGEFAQASQ